MKLPLPPETGGENPGTEPEESCEGLNDRCDYYEHLCEDGSDCSEADFIPFAPASETPEGGECGACAIFKCPGFEQFLGHLYDIADFAVGDVEPPPVPDLPRPKMPNIFEILNDVEQRNIPKPTGEDGIGDTTFDAEDIKKEAKEIPVRNDPTGGFNIIDPLSNLPDDGSNAPRPNLDDKANYPGGGNGDNSGSAPTPRGKVKDKVGYPKSPGGEAKQSDTKGSAKYPIP